MTERGPFEDGHGCHAGSGAVRRIDGGPSILPLGIWEGGQDFTRNWANPLEDLAGYGVHPLSSDMHGDMGVFRLLCHGNPLFFSLSESREAEPVPHLPRLILTNSAVSA